jgi:hydroxypyruvate reductase
VEVLERFRIWKKAPAAVRRRLSDGAAGRIGETPKSGDAVFRGVRNEVVGSNRLSADACVRKARDLGYRTVILSTRITGETREIARMHAAIARSVAERGEPVLPPACVLSGGETTVTIRGGGRGGRNQEFALAAAMEIAGVERVLIFSAGTDGTDGPTDAAGAVADGETVTRKTGARGYLDRNDSFAYFEALGDLVVTGPTNTNVMDIHIMLVDRR